jgi:hypothetical protein
VRILHEFLSQRVLVRTPVAGRLLVPQRLTSTPERADFRRGSGLETVRGRLARRPSGDQDRRCPASSASRAARGPSGMCSAGWNPR